MVTKQSPPRLIRKPAAKDKAGFTADSTLYDAMNRLGFPRPVNIGEHAVAWVEEEVDDWIAARIAARDDKWQPLGDAAKRVVEKLGRS
jgi:prophage regulatory protein